MKEVKRYRMQKQIKFPKLTIYSSRDWKAILNFTQPMQDNYVLIAGTIVRLGPLFSPLQACCVNGFIDAGSQVDAPVVGIKCCGDIHALGLHFVLKYNGTCTKQI